MTPQPPLDDLALHFDPVGSWPLVAAVTVVLAAVLVAVPPDRTRTSASGRAALVVLRLLAFLALVACLLRPTLVASTRARREGTVLVLADASESMTVTDVTGGRSRWQALTEALAAARPAARALLAEGGFEIRFATFDRVLHPAATEAGDPFPTGAWADAATADETALGSAIDEALRAASGRTVAGVILLSDGAQHAYAPRDLPPQEAARNVAAASAPLWTVTFGRQRGGNQGRDAAVVGLTVAETVYLENQLEVVGRVRLEGLAGKDVDVVLLAEDAAGRMEEVTRTTVRTAGETGEESFRMDWTPTELGERKLAVRILPQEGEVVLTNNELATFVNVLEGGLRVLYLEGALRVEQRFLRRVLASSPDMRVDFRWIDAGGRSRWPVDISRDLADDVDVFLIGDLDSSALRAEDLATIAGRVDAGAGIGLLGGFHAFEAGGWAASPLGGLVPFQRDDLARQRFDEPVRQGNHIAGPLRMLPDRQFGDVSILRLGRNAAESRTAWEQLPPLAGANALGRLRTDAPVPQTLAVTGDGLPLLVARTFGEGRVLAFAADSTWRWVMQGAGDHHRRFWRQLVLWLARRDEDQEAGLWVRLAQRRVSPGAALEFDAGLGEAGAVGTLEAAVVSPSGQRRPVRVVPNAGVFSGTITAADEPGDWRLVVRGQRPAAEPVERQARFTVFRPDLELANPRANHDLMRQIAEQTSGGPRQPEELPDIFRELAERPAEFESREQWSITPWDTWPMLLALTGLLIAEWWLRKRWGLV